MNQKNLHVVLEDLKQDLEIDTTSTLYVSFIFPFQALIQFFCSFYY